MRLGVVSDIHEDAERLAEALRILEKRNCDEIACLGDIVGFDVLVYRHLNSRNASRCLAMVRENCRHAVIGNHDLFAVRRLPAGNSLFTFPADWYAMDFRDRDIVQCPDF
jgi:predicted phosphodiesterase